MMLKRSYLMLMFFAMVVGFTSCSDDDDGNVPIIAPTGSLDLGDNPYEDGMVTVNSVTMSDNGWVVVYGDNDGVVGTDVLGYTEVNEGITSNVNVQLDDPSTIQDGDVLWVALHTEVDDDDIFDWDGFDGDDEPITDGAVIVVESFVVDIPMENSVTVEDQSTTDNTVTLDSVIISESGWVVIHEDNEGAPGAVVATEYLEVGSHDDVVVTFNEGVELNPGDMFWAMLHSDTGTEGEYEFDGENGLDLPIIGDDNMPVMEQFAIIE